jgi:hypothetical protein
MSERYPHLPDKIRHGVRNAYWAASLERLRFSPSILAKRAPRVPDAATVTKVRVLLDSIQGFVIRDDSTLLDKTVFSSHSNNFRPHVVNELGNRLGISDVIAKATDSSRLRAYFGVTKKAEVAEKLTSKLTDFYERRNETVHSLNTASGYATDVILDYINLFEMVADSIKHVLGREIAKW